MTLANKEALAVMARKTRQSLLQESDWAVLNDVPMAADKLAEWKSYRQSLRDISTHSNWPLLEDSDWPTKPS
jgi:hypothetical protein